ncbi:MAG: glycosyltransferase family 4 protein [Candidatus Brocadiia bacterium]
MKLLSVAGWLYPDQEGGSFRVVYEAGRRLARRGHEVHVLTQRLRPDHAAEEELAGMRVHRYATAAPRGVGFYLSTFRQVRRQVDRLQAAVGFEAVHLHHPVAARAANRAASIRRLPRITMLYVPYFLEYVDRHTYDPRTGRQRGLSPARWPVAAALRRLEGANLRRSDRVVVLSDFSRRLLERHYPRCAGKAVRLPGGADLEEFRSQPSRAEARSRLGLAEEPPIFLACRRLEHRMGVVELVDAAARLRQAGREARVLIAGRGALEGVLRERIARHGLEDCVRLLGFVPAEALPLHYRAADCVVMPTRALEGFGLVSAEALASGTPVLGTPVGATPEILEPLEPRLVAEDATGEGLCRGMERFLDELAAEPGLSERCRAYAEQHLSWDRLADGLEELFGELVAH